MKEDLKQKIDWYIMQAEIAYIFTSGTIEDRRRARFEVYSSMFENLFVPKGDFHYTNDFTKR